MDNNNNLISSESFNYNPAGNMTIGMDESVVYDTNNRIVEYQGTEVTYDADGNMLISPIGEFTYDSANRLTVADTTIYAYDVENIRVKKCIGESITEYTHNANSKLSQLLMKTENGVTTYYIYGLGLIYETTETDCKVYHYDYRGSTVALTNLSGDVTDTFTYDTYGKLTTRTGTTSTPFLYNGRDGVMTDENGLVYMRARYYSPTLKRFINADVVAGSITNAITLNRYAYANGNPVSNVDPFGLSADMRMNLSENDEKNDSVITVTSDENNEASSWQQIINYLSTAESVIIQKSISISGAAILGLSGSYSITTDGVTTETDWGLTLTQGICIGLSAGTSTTIYFGYTNLAEFNEATIFSKTVNFGFEITIMYEYKNGSEIPVGFVIPSAIPVSDLDLNQLHITLDSYDLVNMIPDISIGEVVGIYVNSADMIN